MRILYDKAFIKKAGAFCLEWRNLSIKLHAIGCNAHLHTNKLTRKKVVGWMENRDNFLDSEKR